MPAIFDLDEHNDEWVLTASGEIDFADNGPFRSCVERILARRPDAVILDMAGVRYLDSSGLGLLIRLQREFDADSHRIVLIPSPSVLGVLDITRLTTMFRTAQDLTAAFAAIRSGIA